jgi:phosphoribosylaminoimidazole-succinocarboxamide synthase
MDRADDLLLNYEGSVKNVYRSQTDTHHMWFQFTDHYSVFDWGKMPDRIANKGESLAKIGAYFFEQLGKPVFWTELKKSNHLKKFDREFLTGRFRNPVYEDLEKSGLASHFMGLVKRSLAGKEEQVLMKVLAAEVLHPVKKNIDGQTLYFYDLPKEKERTLRLIPLEVVFRFGMGKGSSLIQRIQDNPDYALTLGLKEKPVPDSWFARPVIEFFTKLEPKDRHLSFQEAALMASISGDLFEKLVELAIDSALALHHEFAEKGLELWDGKFEFLLLTEKLPGGETRSKILLADAIGPDELRLVYGDKQLSKEFIRQYYRTTPWSQTVMKAQKDAISQGVNWKELCQKDPHGEPEPLPKSVKYIADHLYGTIANRIIGKEIIKDQLSLDQLLIALDDMLLEVKR